MARRRVGANVRPSNCGSGARAAPLSTDQGKGVKPTAPGGLLGDLSKRVGGPAFDNAPGIPLLCKTSRNRQNSR